MRTFSLMFLVLAACELQHAPPKQEAPPEPSAPTPPPTAAPAPADAGVAPEMTDGGSPWSEGCKNTAMHIADVIITTTTDVAQKAIFAQDREKMVRAVADVCTSKQWSDLALRCYMAAQTQPDLKACEKKFTPVPVPPPQPKVDENAAPLRPGQVPAAGSGSAAKNPVIEGKGAGKGSGSAKAH